MRAGALVLLIPLSMALACSGNGSSSNETKTSLAAEQTESAATQAVPTVAPTLVPTAVPQPVTLRVISYNVLWGGGVDPEFVPRISSMNPGFSTRNRVPEIVAFLKQANADIVGIEEASGWERGNPSVIQDVASRLGMRYSIAPRGNGLTMAILSKFEIVATTDLYSQVTAHGGALRVNVSLSDGSLLTVYIVHLDPFSLQIRSCHLKILAADAARNAADRAILIGDFNTGATGGTNAPELTVLSQTGWGLGAAARRGGIDQIWVSSADWSRSDWWTSVQLQPSLSDHDPVGAEITLQPGPAIRQVVDPGCDTARRP